VPRSESRGVTWVEPLLVAEAAFTGWTRDKRLRHPTFRGLRSDKAAKEVARELPAPPPPAASPAGTVAGVRVTHPDRVLFGGVTKLGLARWYDAAAERLLPHLKRRPLALLRCPSGSEKSCFFQKLVHDLPEPVFDAGEFLFIEDRAGRPSTSTRTRACAGLTCSRPPARSARA
jgi:bifunctional non-homologous end joining protein LigD